MSLIKILFYNVFIFFALVGICLLAPPFIYWSHETLNQISETDSNPIQWDWYTELAWSSNYWMEFNQLSMSYQDYVSWRRDDFEGETINIKQGLRLTTHSYDSNKSRREYWFFGGSTTWGTGVNDSNTYPSIFANFVREKVANFGETGYIARQSLALLVNHIVTNDLTDLAHLNVVFYDGVNDVASRCRKENSKMGTSRDKTFQNKIEVTDFGYPRLFGQLNDFLGVVLRRVDSSSLSKNTFYDCSSDEGRAFEVAETLVNTWQMASDIVESRGGTFVAVLQPVAYFRNPDVNYLDLSGDNDLALKEQYQTVYPLILRLARSKSFRFIDLTKAYDECATCYLDFCHVGPKAHEILVPKLAKAINDTL